MRMGSREVGLVHRASMAGILASLAYIVVGLAAGALGDAALHIYMMAGGALGAFVVSVESSYIVSALRARESRWLALALLGLAGAPLLASAAPPLGALLGSSWWAAFIAVASALESIPAFLAAARTRGAVRASLAGAGYTNLLTAAYMAAAILGAAEARPLQLGLGLLYALPLPMIYAVTVNALPSTYRMKPLWPLVPVPFILTGTAALWIGAWGPSSWAVVAGSLSAPLYLLSVGAHRVCKLARDVMSERKPEIVVRTHLYFLRGHVFAWIVSFYLLALALLYALGVDGVRLGCIIHATAIGFAGIHIFIHAPMMLPVILGIPTARRYSTAPYILISTAAAAPCISHKLLWAALLPALASGVLVVWPPPKKRGEGGRG